MKAYLSNCIAVFLISISVVFLPFSATAQTEIRKLKSGFWEGALRADANGNASYCYLLAQTVDEKFNIQLYWNAAGFNVLIYSDNWSFIEGEEFKGRVRIDKRFNGLIDASVFDSESLDYAFGFNKKAIAAFQSGTRITLEGPGGEKTFLLSGTRKAVNVLRRCADKYLSNNNNNTQASTKSDLKAGLTAYRDGDFAGALARWRPLAQRGNARAQTYIGEMYRDGEGVDKDFAEAIRWFRRAADQGNKRAQNNLGIRYYNGQGVTRDYEQAVYWFRVAADQGFASAQNNLGEMYRDGEGVATNADEAIRWFRLAAGQDHARGQKNLDKMLALGAEAAEDEAESSAATSAGIAEIPGQNDDNSAPSSLADDLVERALLILAEIEDGTAADAYVLANGAAELGDRRGRWMAGRMALAGVGVEQNRTVGLALVLSAAEAGHPEALTYMGLQYLQDGDPVTDVTGTDYLERAAAQSHAPAISALRFFRAETSR